MSTYSDLVWVNKDLNSSSLSNCRSEKDTFRRIRSRALIAGHKSSRVKRPMKRTPLNLSWTRRTVTTCPTEDLRLQSSSYNGGDEGSFKSDGVPQLERCIRLSSLQRRLDPSSNEDKNNISGHVLSSHHLDGIPDPFSSYSIELDTTTLNYLWYFENIWTQCAFKLPGCVGYWGTPIPQAEVTTMIQYCLTDRTRSYCLLAATSARMQYIHHHHEAQNGRIGLAHGYAAKAMSGVRKRMLEQKLFEEEDAINVLFLATYEMFSMNEEGAGKHLVAVRRMYRKEFSNTFVGRLQVNLEVLAEGAIARSWCRALDRKVQLR